MPSQPPRRRVRPYAEVDLPAWVAISQACDPQHALLLEEARQRDALFDTSRYFRTRCVAEDDANGVIGWGEAAHMPWQLHARKYELRVEVHPDHRRSGAGSALLDHLLGVLRTRDALLARAMTTEDNAPGVAFLAHHGFGEVWRRLPSRLDVTKFDPAPFAAADRHVEDQGVTITTLAAELARCGGDPVQREAVLRAVYDLHVACNQTQQELDPITPPPFEEFFAGEVEGPQAMADAWFLARHPEAPGRFVGASSLERLPGSTDTLESGYTSVHPAFRRRGIALALKLRTIAYARDHGYAAIATDSSAVNTGMLTLNARLGFQRRPALVIYELRLA